METAKNKKNSFVLILALCFVLFVLIFVSTERLKGGTNVEVAPSDVKLSKDDIIFAEKFGFGGDKPEVVDDPVLGRQFFWHSEKTGLVINNSYVKYTNKQADLGKVGDTRLLQQKAQAYVESIGLSKNNVINYDMNRLLSSDGLHYEVVENNENSEANMLEVVFEDIESGEDTVKVTVGGTGDVLEVFVYRR